MYLTPAEFIDRSPMPAADVHQLNDLAPAFLEALLREVSSRIDARLRKRYAVPFKSPVPEIVKGWVLRIATPRAYIRLGVNPSDVQFESLRVDGEEAWKEIAEAANSQDGLFDLPLRAGSSASGISTMATFGYSEATPYGFLDTQRRRAVGGG